MGEKIKLHVFARATFRVCSMFNSVTQKTAMCVWWPLRTSVDCCEWMVAQQDKSLFCIMVYFR